LDASSVTVPITSNGFVPNINALDARDYHQDTHISAVQIGFPIIGIKISNTDLMAAIMACIKGLEFSISKDNGVDNLRRAHKGIVCNNAASKDGRHQSKASSITQGSEPTVKAELSKRQLYIAYVVTVSDFQTYTILS
jgi:hypothetical protein